MKKFFSKCLLAASILLFPTMTFAETTTEMYKNVYYKGIIEKNGHLYVPIRDLFSELEAPIIWNAKTNSVKVYYKNTLIEYFIGSRYANVNTKRTKMDTETIKLDGKVFIPLKDTAKFISSEITKVELNQIQLKHFWGYTFEIYVLSNGTSKMSLPYGQYSVEDAGKIIDRYEGNYVHENIHTEFKGMEGDYYVFHTYYIPEITRNKDEVILNQDLTNRVHTRYLWNRYLVHKETGELIVQ